MNIEDKGWVLFLGVFSAISVLGVITIVVVAASRCGLVQETEKACLAAGYPNFKIPREGRAYCVNTNQAVPVEQLGETK